MSNMNYALMTMSGRLTKDPEMLTTKSGKSMCKFRVAINRKTGRDTEKTSFIDVVVFDREASNCGEYLSKGRTVMVTGRFETEEYTDKDGKRRTSSSVVASTVMFGSGGRSSDDAGSSDTIENSGPGSESRAYRGDSSNGRGNSQRGGYEGDNRRSGHESEDTGRAQEYLSKNRGRGYEKRK